MKIALAHVADSREDFLARRKPLIEEEMNALSWLRERFEVVESDILTTIRGIREFADIVSISDAQAIVVHIPIWADPIFTIKISNHIALPVALLGNGRPDTSSTVGLLGAGGALDQIGLPHLRILDHHQDKDRRSLMAFVRAAATRQSLRGQTLGLFGGRSLGIFSAVADPAQWQKMFGIDIVYIDQAEIIHCAESLTPEQIEKHTQWFGKRIGGIEFGGLFRPETLDRQIRSYVATQELIQKHELDFVGVKCQPELSDGYVSQCISHMLVNGNMDANGSKRAFVHACESDADGALTMHILQLLSEGQPVALLDIRWYDKQRRTWILANCGAVPASFFATDLDPSGLSEVRMVPHVFGKGGGGALPGTMKAQPVTLSRLCRKNGEYWMAIVSGEIVEGDRDQLSRTTGAFPQAQIKTAANENFLREFGSNHIHMVAGNYREEVIAFCRLLQIPWKLWDDEKQNYEGG